MLSFAIAALALRQVGNPTVMSFLRKGARSVMVTYRVSFRASVEKLSGSMDADLEELPLDDGSASFALRRIVRGGLPANAILIPGSALSPDRNWTAPFLSAKELFDLEVDSAPVGSVIKTSSDVGDLSGLSLPIESAVPMGGEITVKGLVGQRMVLRGKLFYFIFGAKRECAVDAQFDPYSGRPVRFDLHSLSSDKGLNAEFSLTFKAVGTG